MAYFLISADFSHVLFLGGVFKFDKINDNLEETTLLNVIRTNKLLAEAVDLGLTPVFFSTESVFDGKAGFYVEEDPPCPIFNYAQQKMEVEDYIKNNFQKYLIVRLAKVYGSNMGDNTLVTSWLNKLHKNENIFCANDNIFSPIFTWGNKYIWVFSLQFFFNKFFYIFSSFIFNFYC